MRRNTGTGGKVTAGVGIGLALGVLAGTFVLAPSLGTSEPSPDADIREEHRKVLQKNEILQAQSDSSDSIVRDLEGDIIRDQLKDRPVMVIATGDAVEGDINGVRSLLQSAGATDAGFIQLDNEFFRSSGADTLKSLVANTLPAGSQLDTEDLSAGRHAGQAMAAALLMDPRTAEPLAQVDERAQLLQALREAGFIDYEDGTIRPAQGVVVVTGRGGDSYYSDNAVKFITALDAAGNNTVAAGRIEATADEAVLGTLRRDEPQVSTVDSIDRAWARMAAVLAMAEQLRGGQGAYGAASGVDAAAPQLPEQE